MAVNSVTVIVPHYNRPELVRRALLSIQNQTVRPAEVLVVDDGSTPENREKLKDLSDLATIVFPPQKLGPSGARNFGAQIAKGEWLALLDDDDCYLPDKQERQIRYLEAHPEVKALSGGATSVTPDGREEYWGGRPTRRLTLASALCNTASLSPSLLIRRDLYLELGGYNSSLGYMEDFEFGIRLLGAGHEMHFLGEPLFIYYQGDRQQRSRQWSRMLKAETSVINMHSDLARKEFGRFGAIRLRARCYKKRGLWRGRLVGRSVWAWGCALEAMFGRISEESLRSRDVLEERGA